MCVAGQLAAVSGVFSRKPLPPVAMELANCLEKTTSGRTKVMAKNKKKSPELASLWLRFVGAFFDNTFILALAAGIAAVITGSVLGIAIGLSGADARMDDLSGAIL